MFRTIARFIFMLALLLPAQGFAGSSEAKAPRLPAQEVAVFSNQVQQDLAARGVRVAIVARLGRDPSVLPRGVRYTHVSFWVYSDITLEDGTSGRGYRAYNLYQTADDRTKSHLVQDSPADFFAGAHQLNAGIIIPDMRLQQKLLRVIASPTYAKLHNPRYSVLANTKTSQFQNCTEHTLDVIMASLYNTNDPAQIKADIAAYFQPQEIRLSGLKRAMASTVSRALTTEDHGSRVAVATFSSIARFMQTHGLHSEIYRITQNGITRL